MKIRNRPQQEQGGNKQLSTLRQLKSLFACREALGNDPRLADRKVGEEER